MSAFKEYKMGIIDEAEFRSAMHAEFAGDDEPYPYETYSCDDCLYCNELGECTRKDYCKHEPVDE